MGIRFEEFKVYLKNGDKDEVVYTADTLDDAKAHALSVVADTEKEAYITKVEIEQDADDGLFRIVGEEKVDIINYTEDEADYKDPIVQPPTLDEMLEDLESHEDEVECKICFGLFPKTDCTKLDVGYICPICKQEQDSHQGTNLDLVDSEPEKLGYQDPRVSPLPEEPEETDTPVDIIDTARGQEIADRVDEDFSEDIFGLAFPDAEIEPEVESEEIPVDFEGEVSYETGEAIADADEKIEAVQTLADAMDILGDKFDIAIDQEEDKVIIANKGEGDDEEAPKVEADVSDEEVVTVADAIGQPLEVGEPDQDSDQEESDDDTNTEISENKDPEPNPDEDVADTLFAEGDKLDELEESLAGDNFDKACAEVAKYNIGMKTVQKDDGTVVSEPDFSNVPDDQLEAAKEALTNYYVAMTKLHSYFENNAKLEEGVSPQEFSYIAALALKAGITNLGELQDFYNRESEKQGTKDLTTLLINYNKELGPDFRINDVASEPLIMTEDIGDKEYECIFDGKVIGTVMAQNDEEAYAQMEANFPEYPYGLYDGVAEVRLLTDETDNSLEEHVNDRPADIESDQKQEGTDNAVVDCKKYTLVAHSEDEKPVDCNMEKAPLEKPLTESADPDKFTPEEQEEYGIDEDGYSLDGIDEYVRCSWCSEPFAKGEGKYELNMGWLCDNCIDALISRGEHPVTVDDPAYLSESTKDELTEDNSITDKIYQALQD